MALSKLSSGFRKLFKFSLTSAYSYITLNMRINGFNKLPRPWMSQFSKSRINIYMAGCIFHRRPHRHSPTHIIFTMTKTQTLVHWAMGSMLPPLEPGGPQQWPQPQEHGGSKSTQFQRLGHKRQHGICPVCALSALSPQSSLSFLPMDNLLWSPELPRGGEATMLEWPYRDTK